VEIVLGPPGTGKTTRLISYVEEELAKGTPKKAAEEARERAMTKFNLTAKQLPWFRTIHSLCFSALGLTSAEIFEGKKITEFADWIGIEMTGRAVSMEEGGVYGYKAGDRILFMDNLARVRGVSLRQQYEEDHDNLNWSLVDRTSRALAEFKKKRGLHDFTDLLTEFVNSDWRARLDVLIVDEFQDLSWLQLQVVYKLARDVRRFVVAGDDDQAIFVWAGANAQHLIDLQGDVTVLGQSWRVPRLVQSVAFDILRRVRTRREKSWRPRLDEKGMEVPGEVKRVGSLDELDFTTGENILVLARNQSHLKDDAMPLLVSEGVLYEFRGAQSVKPSIVDAIRNWETLRSGGTVPVSAAEKMYEFLSVGPGVERGHKKLPSFHDRDALITMNELKESGGLRAEGIWHDALDKIDRVDRAYMVKALRRGEKITRRANVRLSTIHGSKGGEADHVVLLRDVAYRTAREGSSQFEDEARVFYVATTRAKQRLTIVAPQTRHSYDV
jgi:DNA helicase-2/ATP-dependent DNA helicase PcrA